ncbi:hypothetical protein Aros01_00954 [Streptosporangium roseum]
MSPGPSVADGIGAGFISFVLIKVVKGRSREVHALMWVVAVLFALSFALGPVKSLLGLA